MSYVQPKVLHGDGVTDDTAAFQALIGGKPVVWSDYVTPVNRSAFFKLDREK